MKLSLLNAMNYENKFEKKVQNVIFILIFLKMCVDFGQHKRIINDVGHGGK